MKGLLQKDSAILFGRSRSILIFLVIGILISFSMDLSFVIAYLTMLSTIFTLSTISYDQFDNGMPFLMTLPVSRRTYVQEKYVLCILGGIFGWVFSLLVSSIVSLLKGTGSILTAENLIGAVMILPILLLVTSLMVPLQLKYGAEKSRLALAVVFALFVSAGYLFKGPLQTLVTALDRLETISFVLPLLVLFVIGAAAMLVSMGIGTRILERKEF